MGSFPYHPLRCDSGSGETQVPQATRPSWQSNGQTAKRTLTESVPECDRNRFHSARKPAVDSASECRCRTVCDAANVGEHPGDGIVEDSGPRLPHRGNICLPVRNPVGWFPPLAVRVESCFRTALQSTSRAKRETSPVPVLGFAHLPSRLQMHRDPDNRWACRR